MMSSRVEQAAYNNAHWCDTVCRAHNIPGEFHDSLWLNRYQVPRFYPNAVTLTKNGVTEQLASVRDLADVLDTFSVKDSFSALDLTPFGFQLLFEAMWLWREADRPKGVTTLSEIEWVVVQNSAELAKWETAWNGLAADDRETQPERSLPTTIRASPISRIKYLASFLLPLNFAIQAGTL